VLPEHDAGLRGQSRRENHGRGAAAWSDVVVMMTDGLALLAAWCEFGLLLAALAFVVLRGDRKHR
jgi:hypothetical protein